MHLFAGTVLQFKTDELENDYRQNNAYNQAKVGRNQVGGVEVRAFGLTADNESQCQDHEEGEERQFDIGAKDGEPFAKLQGQNGGPGDTPDEGQGDDQFNNGIDRSASAEDVSQAAEPE